MSEPKRVAGEVEDHDDPWRTRARFNFTSKKILRIPEYIDDELNVDHNLFLKFPFVY